MTEQGKKRDYRHYISWGISVISLLFWFLFPNSIPRLLEALRDVLFSLAFYMCELIDPDTNTVPAFINQMPQWEFAPELWEPVTFFPSSFDEFCSFWSRYFNVLFDAYNFQLYCYSVGDFFFYLSRFLLLLFPLFLLVVMRLSTSKSTTCTERNKQSKSLIRFEKFLFKFIFPVVNWCKDFIAFLRTHPGYCKFWLFVWLLHFNVISILLSLIGYYFYLVSSWNMFSIYTQLLKLQKDLTPVLRFMPCIFWIVASWKLYVFICESAAFKSLDAAEKANRNVLSHSSIITSVYGDPGLGKTQMITAMALSAEVKLFDDAFEIMVNRAAQFPNFPWHSFRDYVKTLVDLRAICDINQAKNWISYRRRFYDALIEMTPVQKQRILRKHPEFEKGIVNYTFGYAFEHYPSTYCDGLKVIHLFEALESYAAAYLIFSVQTTLIFSNYSIRTDSIMEDLGNLPRRNNDFFSRNPKTQAAYSQHSHIIDFDVLRLGRKIVEGNKKANGAPVGVIVVSEIDKEFKNMNLLKETKINANETNQKNDLHDAALMMIRHGVVIDYKPFVVVLADLQRPEAWGAGGRELGNCITIVDKDPMKPVLPFYSTYWFTELAFSWIKKKWDAFYADYCYHRSDETLAVYLAKNVMSMLSKHYERIKGVFGMQVLHLEIQSGRLDGEAICDKWRILSKKDLSNRYRTDCLASVFDKAEPNTMHIDDFIQYAGSLATKAECAQQNSYFQRDIHKIKEN